MRWLPLLLVVACTSPPASKPGLGSAEADAGPLSTLASELAAAATPCEVDNVAALFDHKALLDALRARLVDPSLAVELFAAALQLGPSKFCAWLDGAVDVRPVRVVRRAAESRFILRKVSETGFGHFEVRATATSEGLRIADIYSHNNGTWISEELANAASIPATSSAAITLGKAVALDNQGKHAEALAILDSLPEDVRNTRSVQSLRVAFARKVSVDAHAQAVAEHARRLPDQQTPLSLLNAAYLRGDLAEALRQVDAMDNAVGGDPFFGSIRASVLVLRNAPGDFAKATKLANQAAAALPDISMVHLAKLGVEVVRGDFAAAIATLETMDARFNIELSDDQLRAAPAFAEFVVSAAYRKWRTRRP